jgi:hypothetical protein
MAVNQLKKHLDWLAKTLSELLPKGLAISFLVSSSLKNMILPSIILACIKNWQKNI